jgi:ubiquinone/menaquinone biosynthesis C-methylase UbiE
MKDNRSYYDEFAAWYERERHHGYHAMLDRLQVDLAAPLCAGREVLEGGCGTGLILKEIAPIARRAQGLDLSPGMLEQARARGLAVVEGSATALPFDDASFDTVYSFKVLPHVQDIAEAMREVARVLRPGGRALLEFYNRHSLRYAVKRLKPAQRVAEGTHDTQVFTRYDSLDDVRGYLPDALSVVGVHGIRVFTPFAQAHQIPGVRHVLGKAERWARDLPATARFGGFLVVQVERR